MNHPVEQFGVHLMVDGYGASKERLQDAAGLKDILARIPKEMGMYTISEPLVVEVGPNNKKDPGGLSGFVLIAESHLSFHTFPNRGFVTIDVYTCQNDLDIEKMVQKLTEAFLLQDSDVFVQKRGINYPAKNIY